MPQDHVHCPARCLDGETYPTCNDCDGSGKAGRRTAADADCATCDGSGELGRRTCSLCQGEGRVALPLARLYEADRRVAYHEPGWDGRSRSRPGVTDYALAEWYRWRELRGAIAAGRGRPSVAGERESNTGTHEVDLLTDDGAVAMTLYGLSWGYGGEGPHGLAYVLADAGLFDGYAAALRFAISLPQAEPWVVRARQVAGGAAG